MIEQPWIREIDINPLLAAGRQLIALDARIVLHPYGMSESDLPKSAIRPYPSQYVRTCRAKDGTAMLIRPIRPEDEPMMVCFHQTLSDQSVHNRYFYLIQVGQRIAHERLIRNCFIDYDREMALVIENGEGDSRWIIAVGRIVKVHSANEAEIAVIVSDAFQNLGLGTQLVRLLMDIAHQEKVGRLFATVLPENRAMQQVFSNLGFDLHYSRDDATVVAELVL